MMKKRNTVLALRDLECWGKETDTKQVIPQINIKFIAILKMLAKSAGCFESVLFQE